MKRHWDDDREVETLAMANCMMLLNGVDRARRVFRCKTCNKQFTSFQALGGHRTSHKKVKLAEELQPKARKHECSVCGLEFELGQALGGHMRRHRDIRQVKETVVDEVDGGGRGLFLGLGLGLGLGLDLNLTPFQNELRMWSRGAGMTRIAI